MTKKEKLAELRRQMDENAAYNTGSVKIHRPWIYVEFETHYMIDDVASYDRLWGVAKICWPDKWSVSRGIDLAIRRALAWGAKKALALEEGEYINSGALGDRLERYSS